MCALLKVARLVSVCVLLCALCASIGANAQSTVKVGFLPSLQFVSENGNADENPGFALELFQQIASRNNYTVTYTKADPANVATLLSDVQNAIVDVGISALSITAEREENVDFSHSIYATGLSIMIRSSGFGSDPTAILYETSVWALLSMCIIMIFGVAALVWLAERRENPRFPREAMDGIWQSVWWATVTLTTVGYGDKVPITKIGRSIAMLWMGVGVSIIGVFAGTFSSAVTLASVRADIRNIADIANRKIVTLAGSTSEDYLRAQSSISSSNVHFVASEAELWAQLKAGDADAVVFDRAALLYQATLEPGLYSVVSGSFDAQDYAFAFTENSSLKEGVDRALLAMRREGAYDRLVDKYLDDESLSPESIIPTWHIVTISIAGFLLIVFIIAFTWNHIRNTRHKKRARASGGDGAGAHGDGRHGTQLEDRGTTLRDAHGQIVSQFLERRIKVDGKLYRLSKNELLLFNKLNAIETMMKQMYEGSNSPAPNVAADGGGGDEESATTAIDPPALPEDTEVEIGDKADET